jgi:hypothetical protein
MKIFIITLIAIIFISCGGTSGSNVENNNSSYPHHKDIVATTSWQWQLLGEINNSYDVDLYDIDLFDTNTSTIKKLKDDGKKVICYFSAGSYEDWRDDKDRFKVSSIGKKLDDWEGEKWLDIRDKGVRDIMLYRLDLAKEKGCDGVEPDNVDGYQNDTGFDLSYKDQIDFNKFLALNAKERALSIGLKNDLDQIDDLVVFFDFTVNEQCNKYNECNKLKPFIDANKPVFNAEYDDDYVTNKNGARDKMCKESKKLGLKTLILPLDLDDSFRYSCD